MASMNSAEPSRLYRRCLMKVYDLRSHLCVSTDEPTWIRSLRLMKVYDLRSTN